MKRTTLIVLAAVLAVLIAVAVGIVRSRQPVKPEETPLAKVGPGDVTQIGLAINGATTTLKTVEGVWHIVAPFDDLANVDRVDDIINTLREARIGSPLSENPAKFGQYELTDTAATRLQIYIRGQETPAADLWVGKEAPNRLGSFIRRSGSDEVRVAEGFHSDVLLKNPEDFRSPRVYSSEAAEVSTFTATGIVNVVVERSTTGWVNGRNKRMVPPDVQQQFTNALQAWRAGKFTMSSGQQGFEKPYLTLDLSDRRSHTTIIIGEPAIEIPHARYVRTSDRSAVLIVDDSLTDPVIAALRKIQAL